MNSPLTVIQLTDLHYFSETGKIMEGVNTELSFGQTLKYAISQQPQTDLILLTGDLTQHPQLSAYQRIKKEVEKYRIKTVCLPGNHDNFTEMQQVFNENQINCDKRTQLANWQIICLNSQITGSDGGYLVKDELTFLKDTLEKNSDLHTLIAVHHHSLPTNSQWLDTMTIKNKDEFFSIVNQYPQVKAITCGHIHQEMEIKHNNLLILGTPSTCFQFKPNCANYTLDDKGPGYRSLLLYPGGNIESKIYHIPSQ